MHMYMHMCARAVAWGTQPTHAWLSRGEAPRSSTPGTAAPRLSAARWSEKEVSAEMTSTPVYREERTAGESPDGL